MELLGIKRKIDRLSVAQSGPAGLQLTGPFSKVLEGTITDPFIRNWMDLLCFLLSGAVSSDCAALAEYLEHLTCRHQRSLKHQGLA